MDFIPKPKKSAVYGSKPSEDDDVLERPQDPLVASAMEEDQARKKQKKGPQATGWKKQKDGLTLEQMEELEGGVIRESKTGMAATTRADRRKQKETPDETGMLRVTDLKRAEEEMEKAEVDGITLEPFNLVKEREEGNFDEAGNYVENKPDNDDDDPQDAWLASDEAKVLDDETRRKVEAQKARMASADEAPTITPKESADLMRELIEILLPGETVTRALKRLRPVKAKGKRKAGDNAKAEQTSEEKQLAAVFERLTEVSSTLMDAGELDVYSTPKEEFEAKASKYPAAGDDFDMFGEDLGQQNGKETADSNGIPAAAKSENGSTMARAAPQPLQAASSSEQVDYSTWPVKELARFLKERGEEASGFVEKADLVRKVTEIASRGPEGEQPQVPLGFVFDPHSNYYYNAESGMYYDAKSGAYFSATDGQWYSYDITTQTYVKVA